MAKKKISKSDFNKLIANCSSDIIIENNKKNNKNTSNHKFSTEEKYEDSFKEDIIKFSKQFTAVKKKSIDVIGFHDENNDGMFGAAIAWHYLVDENNKDVMMIPLKPAYGAGFIDRYRNKINLMRDKVVLILDLSFNDATINHLMEITKELIIIDDHHETTTIINKNVFIGKNHGSIAYVWKFFYSTKKVPTIIQYIDNSDRKLYIPYLDNATLVTTLIGFRYTHSKSSHISYRKTKRKKGENSLWEELYEIIDNSKHNFWKIAGKYVDETIEALKYQIAVNAQIRKFQGYTVGILNFNAPALNKRVGRQIITNFKAKNQHIDFVVLWGYEYTSNGYNINLIEDHSNYPPKYNLPQMANKLGKIGGHNKGGGGSKHVGHFYWPRNHQHDIWELFDKKFI